MCRIAPILFALVGVTVLSGSVGAPEAAAQIAVRGDTVYTMEGEPIVDGVVLVREGKVEQVGPASRVRVPAEYRTLTAKVVTPGLIDAHSVVGLAGIYNVPHDQQQLERSDPMQPELRAIDAYNPEEELVSYLRGFGVTTVHTGHGPGALASGQTMVVKTVGTTVDEALLDSAAMVAFTLGEGVSANFSSPGTRSKGMAMLRTQLVKAEEYARKMADPDETKRPSRDLKMEALARVLRGELPALVTAHRATDILGALRLAEEFGFRLVLDGASEAYLLTDEIQAAGVPVVVHATMGRAGGETESLSMETAGRLKRAGIPVVFQSGYESYVPKTRVVLFEAGVAAGNGMARRDALAALTIDAARLLGVEARVGSLAPGKDADLVLFDGDPLEYTTHVCGVVVNGAVVSEGCR